MSKLLFFLVAAALLSIERICYVWVWRHPDSFRRFCAVSIVDPFGAPVAALQKLFYCFKAIQLAVFFAWCLFFANGSLSAGSGGMFPFALAGILIATGQVLNFGVFWRLGEVGVFYGNRFGYEIAWSQDFPFSVLKHPQYVGALLSIWGFFLAMRFPHPDWILLPLLETVYYALGAYLEQ
jgi:phosphatidyl-N-methylethanolamine N-methyltransferase